jgi:hypothetical protein
MLVNRLFGLNWMDGVFLLMHFLDGFVADVCGIELVVVYLLAFAVLLFYCEAIIDVIRMFVRMIVVIAVLDIVAAP